jgi:hypothetical protein
MDDVCLELDCILYLNVQSIFMHENSTNGM